MIAKSLIETLFVAVLAVSFYLTIVHPYFHGAIDEVSAQRVWGWVVDDESPTSPAEVQLCIDGNFVASRPADVSRPDVRLAGLAGDDLHGFYFQVPPLQPGEHEASIYAVHVTTGGKYRISQLLMPRRPFTIEETDKKSAAHGAADTKSR